MSRPININNFLRLASQLEGKRLETEARKAPFCIKVLPAGIEITPESSGKSRIVPVNRIGRFLDEYNASRNRHPGHYQEITFDSSYLLAILSEGGKEDR